MNNDVLDAMGFLNKANEDLYYAVPHLRKEINDQISRRWNCYILHQAIEKSLKAIILCYSPEEFEREHEIELNLKKAEKAYILDLDMESREIITKVDGILTNSRYAADTDIISEDTAIKFLDIANKIYNIAQNCVNNFVPQYLQEFPDFDCEEIINILKQNKWIDTSIINDGMPSFEYRNDKINDVYKVFINYEDHDLRRKELPDNKRFQLLKNGKEISLQNSFDYIIHDFNKEVKRNDAAGLGCGR